jgi:hypothetical protein
MCARERYRMAETQSGSVTPAKADGIAPGPALAGRVIRCFSESLWDVLAKILEDASFVVHVRRDYCHAIIRPENDKWRSTVKAAPQGKELYSFVRDQDIGSA